ncbi:hypothetical protein GCM10019059_34150 [Camelimonas fluminis]|uniref:RES domain-containing protein n=1 Tax=Camelimonas fluminis TaxID=1576911 RepID=A0ABV7UGM4_9HYPH|nr:hypothetical protein [Camelimonas fluminis]GHE71633.1 hypothetical protein GCM10019059_34150 [Camelimonas fluminis]
MKIKPINIVDESDFWGHQPINTQTLHTLLAATRALSSQLEELLTGIPSPVAAPIPATNARACQPSGGGERMILPTDWPRIGGRNYHAHAANIFATPRFRSAWRPGGKKIAIYVAACAGLSELAQRIHIPVFKVSTCAVDRVWNRMRELRRDAYGAVYYSDGRHVREEGWDNWFPSHLTMHRLPSPDSPVCCSKRSLIVDLPESMSPGDFERAFDAETRKGAIDLWAMSPEGRDHCATLGLDSSVLRRLTEYPGGSDVRRSPVSV